MDEFIGDVDGLTSTSWSAEEDVHVVLDVLVKEVVEPYGVIGGNQEVIVADFLRDLERRGCLGPVLPNELLRIIEHVEYMNFLRDFDSKDDWSKVIIRV